MSLIKFKKQTIPFKGAYLLLLIVFAFAMSLNVNAQLYKKSFWPKRYADKYEVYPDIIYKTVDTTTCKLDVYMPKNAKAVNPVLIFTHGGGWVKGSKDSISIQLTPYLNAGWVVVNVGYRLIDRAPAPAAVEDTRCALAWVYENAAKFKIDTNKIVLTGGSAGGHLALITGMIPLGTSLDKSCIQGHSMKVAAIVDFYGIVDVNDLLAGENKKGYAVRWLASQKDSVKIAALVSPINYVRKGLPPIIRIQGDEDPTVPYSHSLRLKSALDAAGVPNSLYTVSKGLHGKFTKEEMADIYKKVSEFLKLNAGLDYDLAE